MIAAIRELSLDDAYNVSELGQHSFRSWLEPQFSIEPYWKHTSVKFD